MNFAFTPFHPLSIEAWLVQTLSDPVSGPDAFYEGQGWDIRTGDKVYPRDRAPRAEETAEETAEVQQWPLIAFVRNDISFDTAGQIPLQKDGEFLVTFVAFEPALPEGFSLEGYVADGAMALQVALSGVSNPDGPKGTVHGCEILGEVGPHVTGPEGFQVGECGYRVRIYAS